MVAEGGSAAAVGGVGAGRGAGQSLCERRPAAGVSAAVSQDDARLLERQDLFRRDRVFASVEVHGGRLVASASTAAGGGAALVGADRRQGPLPAAVTLYVRALASAARRTRHVDRHHLRRHAELAGRSLRAIQPKGVQDAEVETADGARDDDDDDPEEGEHDRLRLGRRAAVRREAGERVGGRRDERPSRPERDGEAEAEGHRPAGGDRVAHDAVARRERHDGRKQRPVLVVTDGGEDGAIVDERRAADEQLDSTDGHDACRRFDAFVIVGYQ